MFGTLKPSRCHSGQCGQPHEYARLYCGTCKSLGDHFGQLSRGMLTYDAVFLALVADGLAARGAEPDRCRCPLLPVTFRPTVRSDSPAMRYAAAMQVLLADQYLADRALDGRRVARVARPLLASKVVEARALLTGLGVSLADLEGVEHRQARVERAAGVDPRDAAEPTAAALERVFERMAQLPGVAPAGRSDEGRATLAAFGRRLGSAIYLLDALDDVEKDHRRGDFNPCLGAERELRWPAVEQTWSLLRDDLTALGQLTEKLPLLRHRELVQGVVARQLPDTALAAAKRAHAYARAERAARLSTETGGRPWLQRALAAVATTLIVLWAWLWSLPAFARAPAKPPPAATQASQVPERWEPSPPGDPTRLRGSAAGPERALFLVDPSGAGAGSPTADSGGAGGTGGSDQPKPDARGSTSTGCRCGDLCDQCCDVFKGCGDTCTRCEKGCDSCGSCCNDCGKGCNDCSCCK